MMEGSWMTLLVYHPEDGNYMLVVNASNMEKDWNWISQHNTGGGRCTTSAIRPLWPYRTQSGRSIAVLTDVNPSEIAYYTFTKHRFAGGQ